MRTLLESRPRPHRTRGGATASVLIHAALIAGAAAVTANAGVGLEPDVPTSVIFQAPASLPPRPHAGLPGGGAGASTAPDAPDVPTVDVSVPESIGEPPDVIRATDDDRGLLPWPGRDGPPGPRGGVGSGEGALTAPEVEHAVVLLSAPLHPRYPESLRLAGVAGDVVVRFVVDTTGRVEPLSVQIVRSTHPLFTEAVRRVLPGARFAPAEAGGRRVRQLVEQPFSFAIVP
jgi:protein TonB